MGWLLSCVLTAARGGMAPDLSHPHLEHSVQGRSIFNKSCQVAPRRKNTFLATCPS